MLLSAAQMGCREQAEQQEVEAIVGQELYAEVGPGEEKDSAGM